jgi:tetratricopeptide (TPR) repeat protein
MDATTYPMGPVLRRFCGISDADYRGDHGNTPTANEQGEFAAWLADLFLDREVTSSAQLTDLIEELVGMDLPQTALRLVAQYPELLSLDDFRTCLQIGNAAMLAGDLDRAEDSFRAAQELIPEEPAPYTNLAQIFLHQGRFDEARTWIEAGLEAEPNNALLWERLASLEHALSESGFAARLLEAAEKRQSWAGMSLASDLVDGGDPLAKFARLDKLYSFGLRDQDFLVELTAVMGAAGKYDAIPQIVWQAQRLGSTQLPWQLWLHLAQAELAMNKAEECRAALRMAETDKLLPEQVRGVIAELDRECGEIPPQALETRH